MAATASVYKLCSNDSFIKIYHLPCCKVDEKSDENANYKRWWKEAGHLNIFFNRDPKNQCKILIPGVGGISCRDLY